MKCFLDKSLIHRYDKYLSNSKSNSTEYVWLPHTPEKKHKKKSPTYSPIGGYSPPKPLWINKKIISKSPTYSPIGGYSPPKPLWSPVEISPTYSYIGGYSSPKKKRTK